MCIAAKQFKNGFKFCVEYQKDKGISKLPKDITAIINVEIFGKIEFLVKLLTPFTKAISVLEREDSNLGEVWVSFIKVKRYLSKLNRDLFPAKFNELYFHLNRRLDVRASAFNTDIYVVALYLMPTYRKVCTSKMYTPLKVHKMTFLIARLWQKMNQFEAESFRQQLQSYDKNEKPHHCQEKNPLKYWGSLKDTLLGKFALTLLRLVPTSASVERLFSTLARTKTKYRNRMEPENLKAHGVIKLETLNEFKLEKSKDVDIDSVMEWEFDELQFDEIMNEDEDEEEFLGSESNAFPFDFNMERFYGETDDMEVISPAIINHDYNIDDIFNHDYYE